MIDDDNDTRNYDDPLQIFKQNLLIYLPYTIVLVISIVIGIIGNLMIGYLIIKNTHLRKNSTFQLILNLALVDLLISVMNYSNLVGVFLGEKFANKVKWLCFVNASFSFLLYGASLTTLFYLALNRYILIFHKLKYKKMFSNDMDLLIILSCWIFPLILIIVPLYADLGEIIYDKKILLCSVNRTRQAYMITILSAFIFLPCSIIAILYLRIFCYHYRAKLKLFKKIDSKTLKLAKSLFITYLAYLISWLPIGIVDILDPKDTYPAPIYVYAALLVYTNSALNPILQIIFNVQIRGGFKRVLRSCGFISEPCEFELNAISSRTTSKP